jgi:CopG family nickel-responsive transcriptional regulator
MGDTTRFGISIDSDLLNSFDRMIAEKGYQNRSEAIRDLIRAAIVEEKSANDDEEMVGTITMVYNHHVRDLTDRLTEHQHHHHHQIVSTLHIHLDHHNCLEVLVLRGNSADIHRIADELLGVKGVMHGKLFMTSAMTENHH